MSIDYDSVIQSAKNIVGSENVLTAKSDCWAYGYDNSRRHAPPDLVVFAEHRDAIQQLELASHEPGLSNYDSARIEARQKELKAIFEEEKKTKKSE